MASGSFVGRAWVQNRTDHVSRPAISHLFLTRPCENPGGGGGGYRKRVPGLVEARTTCVHSTIIMKIRNLFPLLLVAMAAVATMPERASAQGCWYCDKCWWGGGEVGESCVLMIPGPLSGFREGVPGIVGGFPKGEENRGGSRGPDSRLESGSQNPNRRPPR